MVNEEPSSDATDLPVELIGPTPRSVRITGIGWANLLVGASFFLLGSAGVAYDIKLAIIHSSKSSVVLFIFTAGIAFFGLLFVRSFTLERRLAMEGIAAWGCIQEREWRGPSKGQIAVDYTFRNASDEVEIGSCPGDYPCKAGSKVCVLYLPSDPSRSRIYPFLFFRID
jgi:hypothetical protein